jgi:hypothetical protein
MSRALDIAYAILHKTAGAGRLIGGAFHGLNRAGNAISRQLEEAGVRSETAHLLAKAAPYAVTAYGAKKAWESEPVQKIREKVHELRQGEQGQEG